RQAAQEHAVHQTEDRRVGADANRERGNGREREAGLPAERPQRVAHVTPEALERRERPHLAHLLLVDRLIAETPWVSAFGLAHRPMERDLVAEITIQPP